MSKFDGIGVDPEIPFRVLLIPPGRQTPLIDEDGQPAYIDVLSQDSAAAKRQQRANFDNRVRNRMTSVTAELLEREAVDELAAAAAGWHLVSLAGKALDVPCTSDNARDLFADPRHGWIYRLVTGARANEANFFVQSSAN